jgi:hypothetical protein
LIPAPPLYPDELATGALERTCRWFMLPMATLLQEVLKVHLRRGKFLAIGPVSQAAALFNTTPDDLLWNHTTFPYASAFVSEAVFEKAIDEALGVTSGNGTIYAVMRNAEVGISRRRVCTRCLDEDMSFYGESYWHRSHNLPGSFYCVKHRCLLYETSLPAHGRPMARLPVECELTEAPAAWRSRLSWQLAEASERLLARPHCAGEQRGASFYMSLAVETGWMHDEGRVSQPALARAMKACFHEEFQKATLTEFKESRAWPVLAFNPKSCNLSPLKHLMVETLLRDGTEKAGVLSFRSKGAPRANYAAIYNMLSERAEVELQRVMAAGEKLTREDFLRRIGGKSAYQDYSKLCPKLKEVADRLQAWNASVPEPPRLCREAQATARIAEFSEALDETLAAAALAEFDLVVAANERLRIDAFMKRIGALKAWKFGKADCPKLVAVADCVKVWIASKAVDACRTDWGEQDARLSAAAEAELERVIAANESLRFSQFMKRLGASSAWRNSKDKHPKLKEVARRFKLWKKARDANAPRKHWGEIDAQLAREADDALKSAMNAGELLLLRHLKASRIWAVHKADCPALEAVVQRCKAWNEACVRERRRPNLEQRDAKLAKAALVELKRVIANGEKPKLAAFMRRFGALSTWDEYKASCPKLAAVAAQLKAWNAVKAK